MAREKSSDHRNHWARWLLSSRAVAAQRLRGAWNCTAVVGLYHRQDRPSLPRSSRSEGDYFPSLRGSHRRNGVAAGPPARSTGRVIQLGGAITCEGLLRTAGVYRRSRRYGDSTAARGGTG